MGLRSANLSIALQNIIVISVNRTKNYDNELFPAPKPEGNKHAVTALQGWPLSGPSPIDTNIIGFLNGYDRIDLRALAIAYGDLSLLDDGDDVLIEISGDSRVVRLVDTVFEDLDASDFLF